jgi:flagellar motor switch protein FliM
VSESLSQQDIDALFSAEGTPATEAAATTAPPETAEPDLQLYDFGRPARISKDQKRSLMAVYDVLCKSLEGWLTGRCRDRVEMEVESVEALSFGEFTLALRSPCVAFVFDTAGPEAGQGVVDFGHELAFYAVDRFMGGSGSVTIPERGLTPMERLVVRIVAERVGHQLNEAWKDYVQLDMKVAGYESIPEMIQACNREDPVLVANVRTLTGDVQSTLLLSLPFSMLEKFFAGDSRRRLRHATTDPDERAENRSRLERSVLDAGVVVSARLPTFHVDVGTLAGLQVGDVLETKLESGGPVTLRIHDQERYLAVAGRQGLRIGAQITDTLTPDPPAQG